MIILFQIKAILIAGFALFFILLPGVLITFPFKLKNRLLLVCPTWSLFGHIIINHACRAKIKVKQDLRSENFKYVPSHGLYISNHQSFMDIPLISTLYQIPPIMKKEILLIPFFGWIALVSGAIPVARGSNSSRKKVFTLAKKRILEDNLALQVYPEGTRSVTAIPKDYAEIKKTLLVFAFRENIPVIPTSIYGTRGVLTKHGLVRYGKDLGIIVHKEIYPKDYETAEDFAKSCWEKVQLGYLSIENQLKLMTEN